MDLGFDITIGGPIPRHLEPVDVNSQHSAPECSDAFRVHYGLHNLYRGFMGSKLIPQQSENSCTSKLDIH